MYQKNVCFVLDDIVDKYNNTFHKTIKIKPIEVKSDSYAEYNVESDEKDPKFKINVHVRTSKYKNVKDMLLIGAFFLISKIKNTVP